MKTTTALVGIAVVGLALRLGVATRDPQLVDRMLIPDDSYYTLTIARSLAAGRGPSVDGTTPTNGFQPLLAFIMAPVFRFTEDPDLPLRIALVLLAICDALAAALLGLLASRVGGRLAGILAASFWAISPVAIANALDGLETSLALALQLALVLAWWEARKRASDRWRVLSGILAGLALLARIDSVFLVGALALLELARGGFRTLVIAAAVAGAVVAPWWGYSIWRFGSPIPESGAAVAELVAIHQSVSYDLPQQLGWSAGTLLGAPFVDLPSLREWLFARPVVAVAAALAVFAALALACRRWLSFRDDGGPAAAWAAHGAITVGFYTLWLPALWFFRRYLAPVEALVTLLWALAAASWWSWARSARAFRRGWTGVVVALTSAAAVLGLQGDAGFLFSRPDSTVDSGFNGAKGYRGAALQILAQVPDGAVVGAFQSGALAYYARPSVRVVNLDGVVDHAAAAAGRARQLASYARERGVGYFADWPFNVENLFRLSSADPSFTTQKLRVIGSAGAQGKDHFYLLEVSW